MKGRGTSPRPSWERRADAALGLAASAILFAMMALTFVDVVLRYLFNRPLRGGFELTELMLLVLIFAGLPLVSHADEHVTMDFIDRLLPARAARNLARGVHVLCAAVMASSTVPGGTLKVSRLATGTGSGASGRASRMLGGLAPVTTPENS